MGTAAIIAAIANLLSVGLEALSSANAAMTVLKQAQDEGWADGDARWADAFKTADAALQAAFDRLK